MNHPTCQRLTQTFRHNQPYPTTTNLYQPLPALLKLRNQSKLFKFIFQPHFSPKFNSSKKALVASHFSPSKYRWFKGYRRLCVLYMIYRTEEAIRGERNAVNSRHFLQRTQTNNTNKEQNLTSVHYQATVENKAVILC